MDPQIPNGGSGIPRHFVALIHRLASDFLTNLEVSTLAPLENYLLTWYGNPSYNLFHHFAVLSM